MNESTRRRLLIAGVAAGAVATGAGVALWRFREREGEAGADAGALWKLEFQTPQGQTLALARLRGKPLLVNFWATWCPPCVEEFPLLDAFHREHAPNGWQVIGLAIDQPSAVRRFLEKSPVGFPIALAGLEGTELSRTLGNLAGGLPFSVVVGSAGTILQRRMGRLSAEDLRQWAQLR